MNSRNWSGGQDRTRTFRWPSAKLVDRIRNSRSGTTRRGGYAQEEVDEFLDRIMHNPIRGERGTMQRLAGEARFTTVRLRPGYVMADVDNLLGSVEHELADLA